MTKHILVLGTSLAALVGSIAGVSAWQGAGRGSAVQIDADDIGGVVTSAKGPEAGVWVIAETKELQDRVQPHRRHRRSGSVRHSRSAEGELSGVGARLRPRRLGEGRRRTPGKVLNLTADRRARREGGGRRSIRRTTGSRC